MRALRASASWDDPELEEEARAAWAALLVDPDLDAEGFVDALEGVLYDFARAMDAWDRFLASQQEGTRDVPIGAEPRVTPPAEPVPGAGPVPETEDRFLNVAIVWPLSRRVVPADRLLASGRTYELRLDIWRLSEDSLLAGQAVALPDVLLDHTDDDGNGDWLQLTLVSDDLAFSAERHWLFLPRRGPAWVCPCVPGGRHTCEEEHRGRYVHVPFVAPEEPGPARLRMFVSYRGNQLQSVSLTTAIAAAEGPGGATTAVVDYTLTSGFAALTDLPPRAAAVRVGRQDGAMTIDVAAGDGPVATFWLSEHQVVAVLEQARADLFACHAELRGKGEDEWLANLLDEDNGKPFPELLQDMTRLARRGWTFYQMIARSKSDRAALGRVLREPAEIQVCRTEMQDLVFPWALLYDIPVESSGPLDPCAGGWEQVERDASARCCPGEAEHGLNTLCPYGFWGYRHIIEQPPSAPPGRRIRLRAGRGGAAPSLTVARSNRLAYELTHRHLSVLSEHFADVLVCDRRDTLRDALMNTPGDCFYFYGHGLPARPGTEDSTPTVLEIGHDDRILPQDLTAWGEDARWAGWEDLSPLVFLNGCHTADHDARTWLPFVTVFTGLHAAGVVGTEITVQQGLAGDFAERFWELLVAGDEVGSALHRVRMELLRKGNVLGLAYTAYCSSALRLR
ncbi:CHAT domain-containing protein [Streptomyces sp. NPDC004126]|uniref:CHAT domain-containing protein n=1 Tax=Streptomyces sp. NPDC004126 TaxID=3390695 RepID=UPI003CFFEEE2